MNPKIFLGLLSLQLLLRVSNAEPINKTIPEGFLLGAATASYQVEGGWNDDGKGENIWDHFVHTVPSPILDNTTGDVACDSYHLYLEDVEMLKFLGVSHYRFSLSWARILPTGYVNKVNQAGVDYYKNLINALKENNIEPFVTLYHWDLPQALQDIGGLTSPVFIDHFADYARLMFTLFGDSVKYWTTFNEPKQPCEYGYAQGFLAPGVAASGIGDYMCAHTVIKAHAKVYHIYDEEFRPSQNGRIAFIVDSDWWEPYSDSAQDQEAAERKFQFTLGWYAHPIFHPDGNYPQVMIDRIANRSKLEGFERSRLPEFTPEEVEYIKGTSDFLAINTYSTYLIEWADEYEIGTPSYDADTGVTTHDPEPIKNTSGTPWGIRKLLNWIDQNYNHPEIIITENGWGDEDGRLEDPDRTNYISEHLSSVLQAVLEDGVNVAGYTIWSLMDNFQWNSGYTIRMGLYNVDFSDPNRTRTVKQSGEYYKKVISTRCLVDICEK